MLLALVYVLFIISGCKKGPAATQEAGREEPPVESKAQIPAMAFVGVPQAETTMARYEEMSAAGITHSYSIFSDAGSLEKAMDVALRTGIKLFVMCPELKTDPEGTVRRFMNHGALAGYYLSDEPGSSLFPSLGEWVCRIKAVDSQHPCYINLLPNFADALQLGLPSYREYVQQFIGKVPTQLLSFDNYPVTGTTNEDIRERWYENLEIFSEEAAKAGIPFWAFALTGAHSPYPEPTLAALRLQVYSDLAYGAQGIQFFTYWTLYDPGGYNFNNAPIGPDGSKTEVYDKLKSITGEIKGLSDVFLGAKLLSVAHTGAKIPVGTRRLSVLPKPVTFFETEGMGAVVSMMEKGTSLYLVVVNRDLTDPMTLRIRFTAGVGKILKDGSALAIGGDTEINVIEPGDVAIYSWPKI